MIFRRACGLGVERPLRAEQVEAVLRHMDGLAESYAVTVTPHAQPPELPSWLEARGYTHGYAFMKFSRPTSASVDAPTDLEVALVGPERADAFARVISAGFGLPDIVADWLARLPGREDWICLLASADGAPAAAAAAYVQERPACASSYAAASGRRERR